MRTTRTLPCWAIAFDFPETHGDPVFAGWVGQTIGLAPTLQTAIRFTNHEAAEQTLLRCYGPTVSQWGTVVEVDHQ